MGVIQSSLALSLMLGSSNGLQMLQTISIAAAFPFAFVMIFGMVSLVKGLREDVKELEPQYSKVDAVEEDSEYVPELVTGMSAEQV